MKSSSLRRPFSTVLTSATAAAALLCGTLLIHAAPARAEVRVGKEAVDFTLSDQENERIKLSSFEGRYVVLEWLNHDCPYVKKQYKTDNMQSLQRKYTAKGVVWLSIISSAEGKQGFMTADEATAVIAEKNAAPSHVLFDPSGDVGRLYGARTTPQMFVINPDGVIIYMGAIDDDDSFFAWGVDGAKNYVAQALDQSFAGTPVTEPVTKPYGCSIKY